MILHLSNRNLIFKDAMYENYKNPSCIFNSDYNNHNYFQHLGQTEFQPSNLKIHTHLASVDNTIYIKVGYSTLLKGKHAKYVYRLNSLDLLKLSTNYFS